MDILINFVRMWLVGWMISVIFYIGGKYLKCRANGIRFRMIDHVNGVLSLVIVWPLTTGLYLIALVKSKK